MTLNRRLAIKRQRIAALSAWIMKGRRHA